MAETTASLNQGEAQKADSLRLAMRLREAREYLGLAQQLVAERTGIPRVAISAIENGRRRVDALELEKLARLYRHPVPYFLGHELEEAPDVLALAREARTLSEADRQEVLRFARFLRSSGEQATKAE